MTLQSRRAVFTSAVTLIAAAACGGHVPMNAKRDPCDLGVRATLFERR